MTLKLLLCFLPSLAILAVSAYALAKDLIGRKWPTADGKVVSVKEKSSAKGIVKITISYEYLVKGLPYAGDRYSFGYLAGGILGSGEIYSKIERDLPDRPKVKVFYNPTNPAEALLVPGASWCHLIDFSVAGIFLLLGLAVYVHT